MSIYHVYNDPPDTRSGDHLDILEMTRDQREWHALQVHQLLIDARRRGQSTVQGENELEYLKLAEWLMSIHRLIRKVAQDRKQAEPGSMVEHDLKVTMEALCQASKAMHYGPIRARFFMAGRFNTTNPVTKFPQYAPTWLTSCPFPVGNGRVVDITSDSNEVYYGSMRESVEKKLTPDPDSV